ncbi:MAG TPA: hypothetical protein VNM92_03575 [Thermoanaerobaculia bacterium]|nr:hypothetical protein [Thermoanaerobaculia bacterium]
MAKQDDKERAAGEANRAGSTDGIDYSPEGATPPHEKDDGTNAGYDEAAHSGAGKYGVHVGEGGVFGTSGGGTDSRGFHVEEREVVGRKDDEKK